MDIRINKLRLQNFKGVRSQEYDFLCKNASIEGPNGSGKSTVFDAFTWLLFGKDHRGQSTAVFEIKTIDPETGKPYPRLDHSVEAELVVDGRPVTLRRVWKENWVKPTGETEEVMKGHNTEYYVDGVNVGTAKAYEAVVGAWMTEDMFKMLTNPHYFIDDDYTHWKERRKAIMELVKDDAGRQKVKDEFKDVIDALSGRSLEDYRKRLTLEKNANKKDLEIAQNKIAGIRGALPAEVNEAEVKMKLAEMKAAHEEKIASLKDKISAIDKKIAGGDSAASNRKAENEAIWAEITKVQLSMSNAINKARNEAREKKNAHELAIHEAKSYRDSARTMAAAIESTLAGLKRQQEENVVRREMRAQEMAALEKTYKDEKGKAFNYTAETKCHYCGQEIPAATIEEARKKRYEHFLAERKDALDGIITKAEAIKKAVKELDADTASILDRIADNEKKRQEALAGFNKWESEVKRLESEAVIDIDAAERQVRNSDEFRAKAREEQELRVKANNTAVKEDNDELLQEKARLESEISACRAEYTMRCHPLQESLTVNAVRNNQLKAIEVLERDVKNFADAIAKNERMEARAAEYMKADVESVEASIAGIFRIARWKMFDRTLDGGLVEMCEVTTTDGVPYRSMNDAMKILCGLDVIRAFAAHYGKQAPIFIDNAESITQSSFDNPAQIIRLSVKDCATLTLINE